MLHRVGIPFQTIHIMGCCSSFKQLVDDRVSLAQAFPAGRAFSAAFVKEKPGPVMHVFQNGPGVVQYKDSTGSDGDPCLSTGPVFKGRIQHFLRDQDAGGPADVYSFDGSSGLGPAAILLDDLSERDSERHFHQTAFLDIPGQRNQLGAVAVRGT